MADDQPRRRAGPAAGRAGWSAGRGDDGALVATPARLRTLLATFLAGHPLPDGVALRLAGAADLPDLLGLARGCFCYNVPSRRELRWLLTRAHAGVFVFTVPPGNPLIGYTAVEFNRRTRGLYANTTCIAADWRGRGLGRVAFALRRHLALALGYRSIRTHVAVDNGASLHLALAAGYRIVATLPGYYDDGNACHALRLCLDRDAAVAGDAAGPGAGPGAGP